MRISRKDVKGLVDVINYKLGYRKYAVLDFAEIILVDTNDFLKDLCKGCKKIWKFLWDNEYMKMKG